jgi:antitoxin component of MazEF toxin-antitoxin module
MKIPLRRIGNSLGVIVPKVALDAWGVSEGDFLELTERGFGPPKRGGFKHEELDELRLRMALAIVRQFTPTQVRAQILANLHRWYRQGVWVSAFEEWRDIAQSADDGKLFAAMLGRHQEAVRLRQSAPYVGLLSPQEVRSLNEEAAG